MTSFTDLSMVNKLLLVFAFQCSFTASTLAGAPSFGFVDMQDGQLFLHTSTKLTDIGVVYLQYPGKSTQCCMRVQGKALTPADIESNVEAVEPAGATALHHYAVALTQPPTEVRPFIGMALINVKPPVVASNSLMRASTGHSTRYTVHK